MEPTVQAVGSLATGVSTAAIYVTVPSYNTGLEVRASASYASVPPAPNPNGLQLTLTGSGDGGVTYTKALGYLTVNPLGAAVSSAVSNSNFFVPGGQKDSTVFGNVTNVQIVAKNLDPTNTCQYMIETQPRR